MRRLLGSALALMAVCCLAATGDEQAVREADRALVEALAKGDTAAASGLLDEDFTSTDSAGETRTKAQFLRRATAAAGGAGNEINVRTYGQVALVTDVHGKLHVVRVWVKRLAGWRALVSQDTTLAATPTPAGPGSNVCDNPCKTLPYQPKTAAERGVISSWQALETAVTNHDAPGWAPHIADEFQLISSSQNHPVAKSDRIAAINKQKQSGEAAAPPPLMSARMFEFGDTVIMISQHQRGNGKPVHVTRVWVNRDGAWQLAFSQQTTMR